MDEKELSEYKVYVSAFRNGKMYIMSTRREIGTFPMKTFTMNWGENVDIPIPEGYLQGISLLGYPKQEKEWIQISCYDMEDFWVPFYLYKYGARTDLQFKGCDETTVFYDMDVDVYEKMKKDFECRFRDQIVPTVPVWYFLMNESGYHRAVHYKVPAGTLATAKEVGISEKEAKGQVYCYLHADKGWVYTDEWKARKNLVPSLKKNLKDAKKRLSDITNKRIKFANLKV